LILATAKFEDFNRFWDTFSTKGAEKRKQYGSRGAHVFRDPNEDDRAWVVFDWDVERVRDERVSEVVCGDVPELRLNRRVLDSPESVGGGGRSGGPACPLACPDTGRGAAWLAR
jgi:hypothetical protein